MEQWKLIETSKRLNYYISNLGNIKRISKKNNIERILRPQKSNSMLYYCININKKLKTIHRLVAKAFINNPNNYQEIDHINRNKLDNRVCNLRWCNRSKNNLNKELPKKTLTKIYKRGKKFRYYSYKNKKRYIKSFDTYIDALVNQLVDITINNTGTTCDLNNTDVNAIAEGLYNNLKL